jgi:hypothetical protein
MLSMWLTPTAVVCSRPIRRPPGSDGSPSCPPGPSRLRSGPAGSGRARPRPGVARPRTTVCCASTHGRSGSRRSCSWAATFPRWPSGSGVSGCRWAADRWSCASQLRARTGPETDPGSEDRPKLVEGGILAEANGVRSVPDDHPRPIAGPHCRRGRRPPPPTPSGGPGCRWPRQPRPVMAAAWPDAGRRAARRGRGCRAGACASSGSHRTRTGPR